MTPVPLLFLLLSFDRPAYFQERFIARNELPIVPIKEQVSDDYLALLSVQTDYERPECDKIISSTVPWPFPPILRSRYLWCESAVYDWLDPANLNQKPLTRSPAVFLCKKTDELASTYAGYASVSIVLSTANKENRICIIVSRVSRS